MNNNYFEKIYIILQDKWYIEDYDKIKILSDSDIEKIKKETLSKDSFEKLWYSKYKENLSLILKYQQETKAPAKIIWKTLFHFTSSVIKNNKDDNSDIEYIILWILKLLWYIEEFGPEKPKTEEDYIKNLSEDENKNQDNQERIYSWIWYNFWIALYKNKWINLPEYWEKILFDWDFCKIIHKIFEILWPEIWDKIYKISPKYIAFSFCIIYVAYFDYKQKIEQKILEDSIFSPYQFNINNNPYAEKSTEEIKNHVKLCIKNYKNNTKKTTLYNEFSFDCWLINILRQKKEFEEILEEIRLFKKKYSFVIKKIQSPSFDIKWINPEDSDFFVNQRLHFDMLQSIYIIKSLLKKMKTNDFRELFDYLNHNLSENYFWYKNTKFLSSYDNEKRRNIIELSRIFLYQKIRQKEFDRIHSIYEQTKTDVLLRNIYNLVLWKFSLALIKIWVNYFTEGYHILLKQMFKNFRLQTPDFGLEDFNLPKEAANDLWTYELENDEDIRDSIFNDEWIELEMKASICLDWTSFLKNSIRKKLLEHSYLKPLVAFLNTGGWRIILWIWEGIKLEEELDKWTINKKNLEDKGLKKQSKANNHYITWIDEDIVLLSTTTDNLKQYMDQSIKSNIYPNPFINNNVIKIYIKKFLGKTIGIIDIPTGSTEYYLTKKDEKWHIIEYEMYVRQNASDHKIKTPKDAVEFSKSRKNS